jgi:hypothetical protein
MDTPSTSREQLARAAADFASLSPNSHTARKQNEPLVNRPIVSSKVRPSKRQICATFETSMHELNMNRLEMLLQVASSRIRLFTVFALISCFHDSKRRQKIRHCAGCSFFIVSSSIWCVAALLSCITKLPKGYRYTSHSVWKGYFSKVTTGSSDEIQTSDRLIRNTFHTVQTIICTSLPVSTVKAR